jgi:Ig-like domain-containing protein
MDNRRVEADMKRTWAIVVIAMALVPAVALATHIPSSSEKINYKGPLTPGVAATGTIGWGEPINGYDWYCVDVTKGTKITLAVTRTSGDLKMNCGIMRGLADPANPKASLPIAAETSNSTVPDVTLNFTSDFDGPATVWISTWLGEKQGNYSVVMTGGTARAACGAVTTPTPATPNISVTGPDEVFMGNDQTISVPISVNTVSTFSNEVALNAVGLPDDVILKFDKSVFPAPGSGSTNLNITTGPLTLPGRFIVNVVATGGEETVGTTFPLTIDCTPPLVLGINQPKSITVNRGSTASLQVTATGSGPFFYQWFSGFSGLASFPIANAKNQTFTTPAINDTSQFWVRVSNACGSVDSQTITVTPR